MLLVGNRYLFLYTLPGIYDPPDYLVPGEREAILLCEDECIYRKPASM